MQWEMSVQRAGVMSLESMGGENWKVSIVVSNCWSSGTWFSRCSKSKGSRAPVSGLRFMPMVPPV